uniref:Reverse transcriptase domain-containing protein n=1 Tax=Amphimedon queenslandica TaxID=400682 RepID=A0A1X7VS11_AMPQE
MDYEVQISKRKKIFHINLLREWQEDKGVADYYFDKVRDKTEDGKENGLCKDDGDELANWNTGWESSPLTAGNALSEQQGEQFGRVLRGKPGHTAIAEHGIFTGSCRPVRQPPCRISYAYRSEVDMEIQGIAETEIDAYPMPRMDDVLDRMGQAGCFTSLDLARGYWQVPVAEGDRHWTAFVGPFGLCRLEVVPFGLSGAPAAFQRLVDHIAGGLRGFAHAYLDGLVVFSATWEDHLEQLATVLGRLQEAGLAVKPSGCQFAARECACLGHVIVGGKVVPVKDKLKAIRDFPRPESGTHVWAFLSLTGYCRGFVPGCAAVAVPLTEATEKSQPQ